MVLPVPRTRRSDEIQPSPTPTLHPHSRLSRTMSNSTVDYNSKETRLESEAEAEKFGASEPTETGAAVPVEQGGLTQYELANDPHR